MDAVHLPADKEMESEKVMAEASQTLPRHRQHQAKQPGNLKMCGIVVNLNNYKIN